MAELSDDYPTLSELTRAKSPNGMFEPIVHGLAERNPIISHIVQKECNNGRSEQTVIETSLPTAFLRSYNEVVADSKGTTATVTDNLAMLEQWSRVDADLVDHEKDKQGFRAMQAKQHLIKMSHEYARLWFYGNGSATPKEYTGFAIRYSDPTAGNGRNVIDALGTGSDNTSIYLIRHGSDSCYGLYPEGSVGGLKQEDFGRVPAETHGGQTGNIVVYKERFAWTCGMAVKDWRLNARIGSIDVSDLRARAGAEADLVDLLISAAHALDTMEGVKIYCNRTVYAALHRQVRDSVQAGGGLTFGNYEGMPVVNFLTMPIFVCDAILNTEAAV